MECPMLYLNCNYESPVANPGLPLRQRDALPVTVQHVLDVDRGGRDVQDAIAAVDDVAFRRNEDILTGRQKDLFGFSRLIGETKKLQVDGWRRRRWWWNDRTRM